jgi:hypothetical protein
LVKNINESEVIQEIPIAHVDYLFHSLDSDRSGFIDLKEFYHLCEIMQNSYTVTRTSSWLMRTFPGVSSTLRLDRLRAYVLDESGSGLQGLVTTVLLLNSGCILLESIQDLYDVHIADEDVWGWVEFGFSIVYAGELGVKLATIPFTKVRMYKMRNARITRQNKNILVDTPQLTRTFFTPRRISTG